MGQQAMNPQAINRNLNVATFNVWHGLAGRGVLRFREFETAERRVQRFALTRRMLAELDPDILLLQELNPVAERGRELVQELGGVFTGRVDQSGLKFFARGLPLNLATGLGLLVRGSARVSSAAGVSEIPPHVRLSGGLGFSGERMSFHLDEQRYAQVQSIEHAVFGRLLVANAHLHHGFEKSPELLALLEAAVASGRIEQRHVDQLMPFLDRARDRRLAEIDRLLEVVHTFERSHDGVIIGGDLNSMPNGVAYCALVRDGYRDVALSKPARASRADGPTWDPITNVENHRIQREVGFDFPLPTFENPEFTAAYRAFDQKPRRIDFLFAKGSLLDSQGSVRVSSVQRFGFVNSENGLAPSDHFGLIASFI